MINLNFHLLEEPIPIERMTVFSIADTKAYSQLIENLYYYDPEGDVKLFLKNQDRLKESDLILITDLLDFNLNTTRLLKKIYLDLENQLNIRPEIKTKVEKTIYDLMNLINEELIDHDLNLTTDEFNLQKIFKILGIHVEVMGLHLYDKILEIIEVYSYLNEKDKLLVFVNTLSYFTREEIEEIKNYISLNQVDVLFLEGREIEGTTDYYLDSDYFLFKNML